MACEAKIRPFRPINETELTCEREDPSHARYTSHWAVLADYAYEGSETRIEWDEHDRRNFRGLFVPCGDNDGPCVLPWRHAGQHVEA